MKVSDIVSQVEALFGRQSELYLIRMINDALDEISTQKQHYTVSSLTDLEKKKRWYELPATAIDVMKVEVLDTNSRYIMIPKLSDSHRLLREDTDNTEDSLT